MRYVSHEGLTFDLDDSGPDGADVVLLLHGWPQDRTSWDAVAPTLVAAGLRVVAPDLRGYSPGARPPHFRDYEMDQLVGDVVAMIDATGARRVHLVGHDWGGALAWAVASRHPDRLASLTVLSTPHPAAMAWALRHADQARRSWYMVLFALPKVMAAVMRRLAHPLLRRIGLPEPWAGHYARRLALPGAAQGSLNWYRAALTPRLGRTTGSDVATSAAASSSASAFSGRPSSGWHVPTTYVWGAGDPALGRAAAERTVSDLRERLGEDFRFRELSAAHWLPETRPDVVAEEILHRVQQAGPGPLPATA